MFSCTSDMAVVVDPDTISLSLAILNHHKAAGIQGLIMLNSIALTDQIHTMA